MFAPVKGGKERVERVGTAAGGVEAAFQSRNKKVGELRSLRICKRDFECGGKRRIKGSGFVAVPVVWGCRGLKRPRGG